MNPTRSHTYTFNLYGVPTVDEMIDELHRAKEVMSGAAKCRFTIHNDQRDGYSCTGNVTQ
jgi:hypothetical protein